MEEDPIVKEGYSKPGFDGRLHYYKIIGWYIAEISNASFTGKYTEWHRYLRGMLSLVKPFIDQGKGKELEDELNKIRKEVLGLDNKIGMSKESRINIREVIDSKLQKATDDLYSASKHMMLPIKEDEDAEYNTEEFFRGSDL